MQWPKSKVIWLHSCKKLDSNSLFVFEIAPNFCWSERCPTLSPLAESVNCNVLQKEALQFHQNLKHRVRSGMSFKIRRFLSKTCALFPVKFIISHSYQPCSSLAEKGFWNPPVCPGFRAPLTFIDNFGTCGSHSTAEENQMSKCWNPLWNGFAFLHTTLLKYYQKN